MGNISLSIHEIELEMTSVMKKEDVEERERRERIERRERKKKEERKRKLYKIFLEEGILV